jgi:hypothetical protein
MKRVAGAPEAVEMDNEDPVTSVDVPDPTVRVEVQGDRNAAFTTDRDLEQWVEVRRNDRTGGK